MPLKRFNLLILIFLFLFTGSLLVGQSESSFQQKGVKPHFKINLNRRRAFWIPLEERGWLYRGCSYYLNRRALPEDFNEERNRPVLSGKQESENQSHFLILFKYPGDYYLHFFYQDYEPKVPDGKNPILREYKEQVIRFRVIDSRHPQRNLVIEPPSQTALSNNLMPKEIKPVSLKQKKKAVSEAVADNSVVLPPKLFSNSNSVSFLWAEHPLQPDSHEIQFLKTLSTEGVTLLPHPDKSAFQLGLYHYSRNNIDGMKKSYKWFDFLSRSYPASPLADEARKRAEYLEKFYLLIR